MNPALMATCRMFFLAAVCFTLPLIQALASSDVDGKRFRQAFFGSGNAKTRERLTDHALIPDVPAASPVRPAQTTSPRRVVALGRFNRPVPGFVFTNEHAMSLPGRAGVFRAHDSGTTSAVIASCDPHAIPVKAFIRDPEGNGSGLSEKPFIVVTSPSRWAVASGTIAIQAEILGAGRSISRFRARVRGAVLGETRNGRLTADFNTKEYPDGFMVIYLEAWDENGEAATAELPLTLCNESGVIRGEAKASIRENGTFHTLESDLSTECTRLTHP
ncbi:MAG TPA: hypothetical protein PLB62_08925 [Candidatus Sumerlaeota bacterium]|nr:hypothetical protein [Candidatus Sumerlaeota bacterium]